MHNVWTVFINDIWQMKYGRTLQNFTTWCIMTQCHGMLLSVTHSLGVKFEEGKVFVSFNDFS